MRKRIGVFIGEIGQDYQKIIANSAVEQANALGYDVVFFCSYGSYNEDILYAEGEKAGINIPDLSSFDGIIATEDLFDIMGMDDELYKKLMDQAKCPIVYLRTTRDDCFSLLIENKASIESMVYHFTDEHGFDDICYMSGKVGLSDSKERLQGYLNAMAARGISVNEHMIFHGDYWRHKGKEAVDWFMEGRSKYPQAIVCANDYMALSICDELAKRGVKVPQDVCVSGFDCVEEARMHEPSLTSLKVDFAEMMAKAVQIIANTNDGVKEDKIQKISAKVKLYKSCGCGEQCVIKNGSKLIEAVNNHIDDTKNSFLSVIDYQDSFEFDEYMAVAEKYSSFMRSPKVFYCFSDVEETGFGEVENDSSFTEQMVLRSVCDGTNLAERVHNVFKRTQLLPDEYWSEDKPNNYCIFTLHFKNVVYGYIVAEFPTDDWFDIYSQGYLMTLSNAIANGTIHKQMEQLEMIRTLYQKDPLTGIYNRRGFDKLLQEKYADYKANGTKYGLVSIDMDNLKTINDTYGHGEGDRAITALARALEGILHEQDFCARVGGDEFSAVVKIKDENSANRFKDALEAAIEQENEKISDYSIGASVGFCAFSESGTLVNCVQIADRRMYTEKRRRKLGLR